MAIVGPPETKKGVCEAPTSSSSEYSSNSSPSSESTERCEGLDLLANAVRHVVGNVLDGSAAALMMESEFWVPFMQRRVVRRRKKAFWLRKTGEIEGEGMEIEKKSLIRENSMIGVESERVASSGLRAKGRRLPSCYDDSMLPPWKSSKRARSARRPDLSAQEPSDLVN